MHDPYARAEEAKNQYGISVNKDLKFRKKFHGIIFAVEHKEFKNLNRVDLDKLLLKKNAVFDIKNSVKKTLST